jgi:transposase
LCPTPIRRFEAFTEDLIALVAWLTSLGVTTVAMEATGVYWRELYTRLEEAKIEVVLADPRTTRNPRGRKTDMQDCRWIWELHAHGLLRGAFVPGPAVQHLRTYLRFRQTRVEQNGVVLGELQRVLSLMNLKLQHVISDIGGLTGLRIIDAILGGERDSVILAKLRDPRCKRSEAELAKALRGTWRPEHLFLLQQAREDHRHHLEAIARCDQAISDLIATMPSAGGDEPPDLSGKRSTGKNDFAFDAQQAAHHLTGRDLVAIDGIGGTTVLNLIGEIGFDLGAFSSSKAFCSWLGLCPNPKRSGGKHLGNLPTTANRAARILRNAVIGLSRARNPIAETYRRIAARRGRAQAITATAHKLARIIYAIFRDGSTYSRDKLAPVFSERARHRLLNRLRAQAERLGCTLTPTMACGG